MKKRNSTQRKSSIVRHSFMIFVSLFSLIPIYTVITSSLNNSKDLATTSLFPHKLSLDNFRFLFNSPYIPFLKWTENSLILSVITSLVSVLVGLFASYAFSRLKFKGRKTSLQLLLLIQVFPNFLALAAIYTIMEQVYKVFPQFGIGTIWGLLLVYLGGSLGSSTWLLKGFIDSIPAELDEAAKIDGASVAQIFWRIFLPLSRPIIVVAAVLSFIGTFNEFVLASVFLTNVNNRTIAVGLQSFVGTDFGQNWGAFAAGSVLAAIPLIAIFLSVQRFIVGGITAGSVKG